MQKRLILAALMMTVATVAQAADGPSLERGKELFESTKLGFDNNKVGPTGKSCASCHPGGRKLEWAATYDDAKLVGIINTCVSKALKGKPLDPAGNDMQSLVIYIKTFAGPGR